MNLLHVLAVLLLGAAKSLKMTRISPASKPRVFLHIFSCFSPILVAARWAELGCRLLLFFVPVQQGPKHKLGSDLAKFFPP